jgi:hypothetical protein
VVWAQEDLVEANHVGMPQATVGQELTLELCVCCQGSWQLFDSNQVFTDGVLR